MKVLHISRSDTGGAGICCLRIHNALLDANIDSNVLVYSKSSNNPRVFKYNSKRRKLVSMLDLMYDVTGIPLCTRHNLMKLSKKNRAFYSSPMSCFDLSDHVLVKEADVIHFHIVDNFIDQPSFLNKVKKPIVWTLHDENLFYGSAHTENDVINDKTEKEYRKIKMTMLKNRYNIGLVFLSSTQFLKHKSSPLIINKKTTIINNPINFDKFKMLDKMSVRKKLQLPEDVVLLLFSSVSIINPLKGLNLLIDAVRKFNDDKIKILAIGNNNGFHDCQEVISVGLVEDIQLLNEYIVSSDLFVLPSLNESFSQTLAEAFACGIPAVAFRVGVAPDVINQTNGVLCNEMNETSLYAGLKEALSKKYNSKKIREDISSILNSKRIADQYVSFYNIMLNDR